MYSYEDRMKAVQLYIQYDQSASSVIQELGYPNRSTLRMWVKEFLKSGELHTQFRKKPRYSVKERKQAVQYYLDHGRCIARTVRALGYPSRWQLLLWIREDLPGEKQTIRKSRGGVNLSQEVKVQAVIDLCARSETAKEIADHYGIRRETLYSWKWQYFGKGSAMKTKKKEVLPDNESELKNKVMLLEQEADQLHDEVYRLRLERDVLEKAAEIIKKDQGVSLKLLTNHEKAIVIDALRDRYRLKELLTVFHMAKSSYCYQRAARLSPDKYDGLSVEIKTAFEESHGRYGYRRINAMLKRKEIVVSDKVVRRIMKHKKMIVSCSKRRKYNSYQGEITPAVENVIQRDFHAEAPNKKWLTDITEFPIPAGKIYLSPIIDCFDGLPVAWTIGTSPDADLVDSMLDEAVTQLNDGEHPIVHSDRGSHYRWPGWIKRMEAAGLTRSMSKKGCSPDNSACEGFFGRLKNEMFYNCSWVDVSVAEFMEILDKYLHWYAEERIKMSLGGLSPLQYRRMLGLCA